MSVSLLLVPLAMAGAAAIQARAAGQSDGVCDVRTRMRDVTLLGEALRDTGATVVTSGETLTAVWGGTKASATFTRDTEGIWGAHFTGVQQERAVELVTAVDEAYGRRVQRAVLERLRDQAPAAGLRLESESVTDGAVQLVFEVERERA